MACEDNTLCDGVYLHPNPNESAQQLLSSCSAAAEQLLSSCSAAAQQLLSSIRPTPYALRLTPCDLRLTVVDVRPWPYGHGRTAVANNYYIRAPIVLYTRANNYYRARTNN